MLPLVRHLDPRRSLAAAIGWLAFSLSIGLVLVASVWVGNIVRADLLDLRGHQLEASADDIADELNLRLALRLQSVRVLAAVLATELHDANEPALRKLVGNLQDASPEFESIVVADANARIVASTRTDSGVAADRTWFRLGLSAKRDDVHVAMTSGARPGSAGDPMNSVTIELVTPVTDNRGGTAGVIDVHLSGRWLLAIAETLKDRLREQAGTEALLLTGDGRVLMGPPGLMGGNLVSTVDSTSPVANALGDAGPLGAGVPRRSRIERIAHGERFLVARVIPAATDPLHPLGWSIVVLQPLQDATQDARTLQARIIGVLVGLGLLATLLGALLARRLTSSLDAIARSADAVRTGEAHAIIVPSGRNEPARLGHALQELLASLRRERAALQALNAELDQRVAARTREIERLAGQARHAAVVRERFRLARDLHDTLAHSMMAMLTEIRLLKRLATTSPGELPEELVRAEEAARQGLSEARDAIARMRFNPVRDGGLAAALAAEVKLFIERTGIAVDYTSDAPAGAFADERAETLFRIVQEALHNIERHAGATHVTIALRVARAGGGLSLTVTDDGIGFDATAPRPGHYGLAGLREQAQLIGAVLEIDSAPNRGTTISLLLPEGLGV